MKRIVLPFVLVTTAAWLAGLFIFPPGYSTRAVSHEFFYLSGTLAWGLMAIALVIAARPAWLERVAGEPLDRLYGHHKTLGLWTIGLSVLHYFGKTVGGTVVSVVSLFGIEAAQVGRPVIDQTGMNALELFWSALRPVAVTSSIWATAFMVLLGVLALSKRIKYPAWLTAHRLFAVVFLVLSLHSVRLMDTTDFVSPFGWINLVVTVVGVWASVVILVKGAGASKSVPATVRAAEHAGGVTILTVEPTKTFAAAPGQFAFLKVSGHEKHPFTIAGRTPEGGIVFAIKGLGDFTAALSETVKPGDAVEVEGPWGALTPENDVPNQVWVAAGIGIAPFLAWLESERGDAAPAGTTLLWCVKSKTEEPLLARVEALAKDAGAALRIFESGGERLRPEVLFSETFPQLPSRLVCCAGAGLSEKLARAWTRAGGRAEHFRREEFDWR